MKALCYGSLNPDLIHRVARLPIPGDDLFSNDWEMLYGGGGGNAAVALATWETDTILIGHALGTDPMGAWLLETMARPHLDLSWVRQDPGVRTPHCVLMITPDGDRTILSTGYDDARWQDVPERSWEGIEVVLVDGYSEETGAMVAAEAGRRGIPVVGLDAAGATTGVCSLVVWSRHEHPDEEQAIGLAADGHPVILTGGPGEVAMWWGGQTYRTTPPPVTSIDGTGAGDVFAAMCAYGLASAWEPDRVLTMAAAAGALLAGRGRPAGIPPLEEITRSAASLEVR
ncbi:MAG: PfkB family carbohydrate kinase [Acidimicrobiia bacterium]|nr:PfkB family carbohydrate kinase [Acidimicrobiia bacterium]MDH3397946.1 PfkB family carbohydrate kinase [Acidimicrobiia bacterium]MDH5616486.1 PfkB family carbohydrate kinase [Acidimicrobiia bacterium]